MAKREIIEDLEQQIAFEKQRTLDKEQIEAGWNEEYQEGYIDGLQQAIDCIKQDH